jgi:hypothetical protein
MESQAIPSKGDLLLRAAGMQCEQGGMADMAGAASAARCRDYGAAM